MTYICRLPAWCPPSCSLALVRPKCTFAYICVNIRIGWPGQSKQASSVLLPPGPIKHDALISIGQGGSKRTLIVFIPPGPCETCAVFISCSCNHPNRSGVLDWSGPCQACLGRFSSHQGHSNHFPNPLCFHSPTCRVCLC